MAIGQLGAALRHLRRAFESGSAAGLTDTQLVDRFVESRDESAFAAIVGRHGPMVLATCRGILRSADDAEDAFQATFLVLARKAGTLWVGESLGGWLHRVARRIAVQASVDSTRRRSRERPMSGVDPAESTPAGPWDDWLPILHEEIGRLPEKYRVPIVLCDLEALTRDEAAGQLGWPPGTVAGRLARGRKLLHDRMARRGVTAGPLAMAVVPPACLRATIQAATRVDAGAGVGAALASSQAVIWSERMIRAMTLTKLKLDGALMILATASGLAAAGLMATPDGQAPATAPQVAKKTAKPATTPPSTEPPLVAVSDGSAPLGMEEVVQQGVVAMHDGFNLAGAKVYWLGMGVAADAPAVPRAITGADGRFRFTTMVPKQAKTATLPDGRTALLQPQHDTNGLVASAEGFGIGFPVVHGLEQAMISLVPDRLMNGRILDIQGRPVAGARVRGIKLLAPLRDGRKESNSVASWLGALRAAADMDEKNRAGTLLRTLSAYRYDVYAAIHPPAVTDAEGRFKLDGIGIDRVLVAVIEGPGIESRVVFLANAEHVDNLRVDPYPVATRRMYGENAQEDALIYGPGFDHIAGPGRTVEGLVSDAGTGKPLPGVEVRADRQTFLDWPSRRGERRFQTTTDADGRYKLEGFPEGSTANIAAYATGEVAYPAISRMTPVGRGEGHATLDFPLKRGVWVNGRVFDRATGKSGRARVEAHLFVSNPNAAESPDRPLGSEQMVGLDGLFRIATFPGPGLITASGASGYVRGFGAEKIEKRTRNGMFDTNPYSLSPENANTVIQVDAPVGTESITVDLPLEIGRDRVVKAIRSDGKPAKGLLVGGMVAMGSGTSEGADFKVTGLVTGRRRQVVVRQDDDRQIGFLDILESEGPPLTANLVPWSSVTGRVVDEEGRTRRGSIGLQWEGSGNPFAKGSNVSHSPQQFKLDAEGRFLVEALVPGRSYESYANFETNSRGGTLFRNLILKPGEARDLGDVRIAPRP